MEVDQSANLVSLLPVEKNQQKLSYSHLYALHSLTRHDSNKQLLPYSLIYVLLERQYHSVRIPLHVDLRCAFQYVCDVIEEGQSDHWLLFQGSYMDDLV